MTKLRELYDEININSSNRYKGNKDEIQRGNFVVRFREIRLCSVRLGAMFIFRSSCVKHFSQDQTK